MVYRCEYCGDILDDADGYADHLYLNHLEEIAKDYEILDEIVDSHLDEVINRYRKFIKEILVKEYGESILKKYGRDNFENIISEIVNDATDRE